MNPCPCGHLGDPRQSCHCTAAQIQRYQSRLSGPLLDRIDLQIEVPALPPEQLTSREVGESSAEVRERVMAARERQYARGALNAHLGGRELEAACNLPAAVGPGWAGWLDRCRLPAGPYLRVCRGARPLAVRPARPRPGGEE